MANLLVYSSTCLLVYLKKIFFFFFYPHTLTFPLKRPVYRGFKGEGKCEGRTFTLTLPSHYSHTPPTLPAGKLLVGDSMDGVKLCFSGVWAVVYRQYSYAALLVQVCCHCWCTYAAPLVFLCWTIGIPMLYHRYQNALLFWYRFFILFTASIFPILILNPSTSSINNHVDNPVEKCVDNTCVIHSKKGRQGGQVDINTLINRYWRKFPRFFIHKRYKLIIFAPNVGIVDKSC